MQTTKSIRPFTKTRSRLDFTERMWCNQNLGVEDEGEEEEEDDTI